MKLKIVTIPDPILTKKTELIKDINAEILKLADNLLDTCRAANGIGIAAPQVGKSIRMCLINLEHLGLPPFILINPKITKKSWKKVELEEGCLSIPGVFGIVRRPEKIKVKALNLEGKENVFEADGMVARVIQHEVDHLDGILFITKIIRKTSNNEGIRVQQS